MYSVKYTFYVASAKMCLEPRERKNLTLDDVKDKLNYLLYDNCSGKIIGVASEGGKIIYSNGDECAFQIYYNGRFCKKYSHGVK